jgi:hypothetical protein
MSTKGDKFDPLRFSDDDDGDDERQISEALGSKISPPDLSAREWHHWLGYLKNQRQEIAIWITTVGRTNLLIGSKRAWLEAYALARGHYQRELLFGFRRWDGAGAGGKEWLMKGGKKLDLRALRKISIAAFDARLKTMGIIKENEGRQRALGCRRTLTHVPEELNRIIRMLERSPTAETLGYALGKLWTIREEAGIDRTIRLVPEPRWLLEGEKNRRERRKMQKRQWKKRRQESLSIRNETPDGSDGSDDPGDGNPIRS